MASRPEIAVRDRGIRELYSTGLYTYEDVAAQFGVSKRAVNRALDSQSRAQAAANRTDLATGDGNINMQILRELSLTDALTYREDLADRDARIAKMHTEGSTVPDVAESFGLSIHTIASILNRDPGSTYTSGRHAAICKGCGAEFVATEATHVYCSRYCNAGERAKTLQKVCPVCHASFKTRSQRQIYCSRRCRSAYRDPALIERDIEMVSLREKGYRNKRLAAMHNLSEAAVRAICSPETKRGSFIFAIRSKREQAAKREAGSWESSRARTLRLLASKRGSA